MNAKAFILAYTWQDKDGGVAQCQAAISYAIGFPGAAAYAAALANRMRSLSEAVLTGYTITAKEVISSPPPASSSNVSRLLVSVLSLGNNDLAVATVPSVRSEIIKLDGSGLSLFVADDTDTDIQTLNDVYIQSVDQFGRNVVSVIIGGLAY